MRLYGKRVPKSKASQVHGRNKSAVGGANALSVSHVSNECEFVLAHFKCRGNLTKNR